MTLIYEPYLERIESSGTTFDCITDPIYLEKQIKRNAKIIKQQKIIIKELRRNK